VNNLNSIILEGNLVRDPEVKTTSSGHFVTTFTVASNRYFREDDALVSEASYFDVETWGKLANACGEILVKGRGVRIVGRLKQDRWYDADNKAHSRIKIVAEHVEFKPVYKKEVEAIVEEETSDEASLAPTLA